MDLEKLKYPIGKFVEPSEIDAGTINAWIDSIENLPAKIRALTENLSESELNRPYRPDGWNIREVIHHVPDSHINAYVRLKWTLSEDNPTIKAYNEQIWATLSDSQQGSIHLSLNLLESLHSRFVFLLRSLQEEELSRSYYHPGDDETVAIKVFIGKYAWHGEHHLAHISQALENSFE